MSIENDIFKKYIPDFKKLIGYGFKKEKDVYTGEKFFRNDEFKAIIKISKSGDISGKVYDVETNDEFLPLNVETQQGAFVGEIREEYKKILSDIRDNCFSQKFFIYNQANRIAKLILEKYGDKPEFMWEKFPDYGVFKNSKSSKWYGLIGDISYSKLDENNENIGEFLNIKLDKNEIPELLKEDGFYPAWHMNKKYWITIALDETVSDEKIMDLIDESYSYTVK